MGWLALPSRSEIQVVRTRSGLRPLWTFRLGAPPFGPLVRTSLAILALVTAPKVRADPLAPSRVRDGRGFC